MADVLSFDALTKAAAEARLVHIWVGGWTEGGSPEQWACVGCDWRGNDHDAHRNAAQVAAVLALLAEDADARGVVDFWAGDGSGRHYSDRLRGLIEESQR